METVSASTMIPASQEEVFAFVSNYQNILKLQPHFASARLISANDQGVGAEIALEGRFHGMPMHARSKIITFDPPHRVVSVSEGSVRSRSTWELSSAPGGNGAVGTLARLTIDYKVKRGSGFLGGLANSLEHLFHGEIQGMTNESLKRLHEIFAARHHEQVKSPRPGA